MPHGARTGIEELRSLLRSYEGMRADAERLDWMETWRKGSVIIDFPGNHGGGAENWLISRDDESRFDKMGRWSEEYEGKTIREAIDAARASAPDSEAENG